MKLIDLYENSSNKKRKEFIKNHNSSFKLIHSYKKSQPDLEWLKIIEENLKYIDQIFRNPNRFIINEEEVVKIELARKITVDSIKHLSKNTNFIQEINEDGEVKPSKILNINKEETFNTYENRLIYTLIKNLMIYIDMKKKSLNLGHKNKNDKQIIYKGAVNIGDELVNINMDISSSLGESTELSIEDRIKKVEIDLKDLTNSPVYKEIDRANVALVRPPIKKTNLILKNANFQRAMILWNFIQKDMTDNSTYEEGEDVINDDERLKNLLDDSFLLNYFILNSVDPDDLDDEKIKETNQILINNLVQKLVTSNQNITIEEIKNQVDKEYQYIREKELADEKEIKLILEKSIDDYAQKLEENIGLEGEENENK